MNVAAIVGLIATIIQLAQTAVAVGKDVEPFIDLIRRTLGNPGEVVSDAELTQIQAQVDALHAELQAPLPPEPA